MRYNVHITIPWSVEEIALIISWENREMMILDPCSYCIHKREELIDGWLLACEAFPDGIPTNDNPLRHTFCNGEIGFQIPESRVEEFLSINSYLKRSSI